MILRMIQLPLLLSKTALQSYLKVVEQGGVQVEWMSLVKTIYCNPSVLTLVLDIPQNAGMKNLLTNGYLFNGLEYKRMK